MFSFLMLIWTVQLGALKDPALQQEIDDVIDNINKGGPFPYKKDGAVFRNREGLLPAESMGYYREYTGPTPGASDRGQRRLVIGQGGEIYYTFDHYQSFVRIA